MKVFTTAKERQKTSEFSITAGYFLSQGYLLLHFALTISSRGARISPPWQYNYDLFSPSINFPFWSSTQLLSRDKKDVLSFFGRKRKKEKGKKEGKMKEKEGKGISSNGKAKIRPRKIHGMR